MHDKMNLTIPAKFEYISVARLTLSSVANIYDMNIDDIDDMKVSISEVITKLMLLEENINIEFFKEDDTFNICIKYNNKNNIDLDNNDMGCMILASLMDKVEWKNNQITLGKIIGK